MSDMQRLAQEGRLGRLRKEMVDLENQAENHNAALQNATFAFEGYEYLDAGNIEQAARSLVSTIKRMVEVRGQITKLEEALGV